MTDVVGRGTIELVGDARKLKASIEDAKKSVRTLGEGQKDISKSAQRSIDQYIAKLQQQNAVLGKSRQEAELFRLALKGASNEQINAAQEALRARDAYAKNAETVAALKTGLIALFAAAVTGALAAAAAFHSLVKEAGSFQDMAEKVGDTSEAMASLAVSAAVGGIAMEQVVAASVKLTKNLTGVDDESKAAGAAIEALGLDLAEFKKLKPADQMEAIAKALNGFEDSSAKAAVAVALFGKAGADALPFLKELGKEGGRQTILTEEQIARADEYSDRQTKLRTELKLYASAIATEMIPAYNDLSGAFVDLLKAIGGVKDGVRGLNNGTEIQEFAEGATDVIAMVIDAFDGVVRAVRVTQIALGSLVASVVSTQRLEFGLLKNIAIETGRQMDAVLNRPQVTELLRRRRAARKLAAGEEPVEADAKPTLTFDGALKAAKEKAAAEAKAQLALDLENLKRASDAILNVFSNSEKILEARRAASLVNDKEYFDAKRAFIELNTQEQEDALQKEIARLDKEEVVGKDRIDNEKKIVEAKAKLAKVRADAVVSVEVLNIQEAASAAKLAQAYKDATIAADEYIASIKRRNAAELQGIGRGSKFREDQAGRIAIEDKLIQERQRIERDRRNNPTIPAKVFDDYLAVAEDTFRKEVALYEERTKKLRESEEDWTNGMNEALANYLEKARDVAKQTEELFSHAFQGMEDALVEFVKTGKLDFKALADSIITDLIRIQVRKVLAGVFGSGGGEGGIFRELGGFLTGARAMGGPVAAGSAYLVGEQGPEIFMPNTSGNIIPNNAAGRNVTVNIMQSFNGPQDSRSVSQAAVETGQRVQRELSRNS